MKLESKSLPIANVTCKTRDKGQLEKSRISCRCRDKVKKSWPNHVKPTPKLRFQLYSMNKFNIRKKSNYCKHTRALRTRAGNVIIAFLRYRWLNCVLTKDFWHRTILTITVKLLAAQSAGDNATLTGFRTLAKK